LPLNDGGVAAQNLDEQRDNKFGNLVAWLYHVDVVVPRTSAWVCIKFERSSHGAVQLPASAGMQFVGRRAGYSPGAKGSFMLGTKRAPSKKLQKNCKKKGKMLPLMEFLDINFSASESSRINVSTSEKEKI
jgi:hypothetical protein